MDDLASQKTKAAVTSLQCFKQSNMKPEVILAKCVCGLISLSNNLCDECKKKKQLLSEYKNGCLLYSEKNTATEINFF